MNLARTPNFRYLPVLETQRLWGLFLTDCGYSTISPNTPYPPQRHPDAYQFDWKTGRTLDEYQVVYLTRGRGAFEARGVRRQTVEAGDVFVLFPGIWHRYAPDTQTGWDEQWIGFNGDLAKRFLGKPFFNPENPVMRIGVDESLRQRFIGLVDDINRDPAGTPFSSAGDIIRILGLIQERLQGAGPDNRLSRVIREAQNRILQAATVPLDFQNLARELGIGYSTFRHRFKQQTGISPAQFQDSIRLSRARELLASTELSISEIAVRCGYGTVYYFSRHFKARTGLTPSACRARSRPH